MMVDVNIQIPQKLQARMEKADIGQDWAVFVQKQIKRELHIHEAEEKSGTRRDVTQRLRASKGEEDDWLMTKGRSHGGGWARHCASYYELKKMMEIDTKEFVEGWEERDGLDAAAYIVQVIELPGHTDAKWCMDAEELGLNVLSRFYSIKENLLADNLTPEFVVAFIKGATEVWEEVKDDI